MAAVALSRIGEKTPEAAALIAGRLSSASLARGYVAPPLEMYLWALGEFGPLANNALPIIAGFTNNASGRVRELAEAAIRRIEGAAEPNAGQLRNPNDPSSVAVLPRVSQLFGAEPGQLDSV